ncbi:MAG: LPS export ABC transporter periplasmic protein LptC [Spongiibacteraceae bacterium]
MNISKQGIFTTLSLISAFAALSGTVLYLTQYSESGKLSMSNEFEATADVDAYIQGIDGVKYQESGEIAYQWQAESAEKYISSGNIVLSQPRYIGNVGDARKWTASAVQGQLSQDGQHLTLTNSVMVRDLIHQAEIETDELHINLERSDVQTDKHLILRLPTGETTSTGMHGNLKTERVELLSRVRGHYAP